MTTEEILVKALSGIDDLKQRNRALCKEHCERIKRLQGVISDVTHAKRSGQALLFDGNETLDPELEKLLHNPIYGL